MRYRNALMAAAFWLLGGSGAVAEDGGLIVGLRGAIVEGNDTHTAVAASDLRAHPSTGLGGSFYAGARLGYGFRLEGEVLYRHFTLDSLNLAGAPLPSRNGYTQIAAPMANVFWDPPLPNFVVQPFIGAGFGGAYVDSHLRSGPTQVFSADNWHFAYQLMAGASLSLSPNARLTGMYRYFRVQDASYTCTVPLAPPTVAACHADMTNQSIDLGLEFDI
ncbi:MAG TPA: P44/Msp2 family outer membrane protein [Rhizomicrobium sp.]